MELEKVKREKECNISCNEGGIYTVCFSLLSLSLSPPPTCFRPMSSPME